MDRQLDGGFSVGQEMEDGDRDEDNLEEDLIELKKLLAHERKQRLDAEERFAKLKNSVKEMNEEYSQFFEDVKKHLIDGDKQSFSSSEQRLDQLTKFVEERFEKWMEEQVNLKASVKGMNEIIQNLLEIINLQTFMPSTAPPVKSFGTPKPKPELKVFSSQPIKVITAGQDTTEVPPKKIVDSFEEADKEHEEDTSKSHLKKFFCICGIEYTTKSNLIIHIRSLTEEGKFECEICNEKFLQFYVLRRHLESKHKIKQKKGNAEHCIGCMDCGKTFPSMQHHKEHRRFAHSQSFVENHNLSTSTQTSETNETGDIPDFSQTSKSSAWPTPKLSNVNTEAVFISGERHGMDIAKRHKGFFCICGVKFINRKRLDGHVRFQNKNTESSSLPVVQVTSSLPSSSRSGTVAHKIIPSRPLQCICGFRSTSKGNTAKHVIYHTNERKFLCDLCPKRFLNLNYLRAHYANTHKLSKDIAMGTGCRKCGISFETMKEYHKHCRVVHSGIGSVTKKSEQAENEIPEFIAPSPSMTTLECRSTNGPPADDWPISGLRIINVRGNVKEEDDDGDSFGSPSISPEPIPIPIYFDDDEDEYMPVMPKFEPEDAVQSTSFPVKLEVEEDSESEDEHHLSSDNLAQVHQHDTTRRSKFFYCTCGKKLGTKKILGVHIKQKTEEWKFPCKICNKVYFYNSTLKLHMLKIHQILATSSEDTKTGCVDSESKLETFSNLQQDQKMGRQYEEAANGNRNLAHGRDMEKQQFGLFYCICGKNCDNEEYLQGHIAHYKLLLKFPCKLCEKSFPFRSILAQHLERKHKIKGSNDVEYASSSSGSGVGAKSKSRCTKCGQNFNTQVDFLRHNKLFHKTKSFREAAKSRSRNKKVMKGNSAHHQISSSLPDTFACACGSTYARKSDLRKHIARKSAGKIFKCSQCPKAFLDGYSLRVHTKAKHKVDLGDQRYGCGICGKLFRNVGERKMHRVQVHGTRR